MGGVSSTTDKTGSDFCCNGGEDDSSGWVAMFRGQSPDPVFVKSIQCSLESDISGVSSLMKMKHIAIIPERCFATEWMGKSHRKGQVWTSKKELIWKFTCWKMRLQHDTKHAPVASISRQ